MLSHSHVVLFVTVSCVFVAAGNKINAVEARVLAGALVQMQWLRKFDLGSNGDYRTRPDLFVWFAPLIHPRIPCLYTRKTFVYIR